MSPRCPWCGRINPEATAAEGPERQPKAGDVSICFKCVKPGIFTGVGKMTRKPTSVELRDILSNSRFRRIQAALLKARSG